jgi:VanZ family protein
MSRRFAQKFIQYHGFSILCGTSILVLCTIPIPTQDNIPLFPNFDKFVHLMMYFTLNSCMILETIKGKSRQSKSFGRTCLWTVGISALFGGLIEIIQGCFTAYRSADIVDLGFDTAGALLSCLLIGSIRLASR